MLAAFVILVVLFGISVVANIAGHVVQTRMNVAIEDEHRRSQTYDAARRQALDAAQEALDVLGRAQAEHARAIEGHERRFDEVVAVLRQEREDARAERKELLDRIQAPRDVVGLGDEVNTRKLHYSEADEIEGTTPAQVAAAAAVRASRAGAERLSPYIDELARAEGIGPVD